MKKRFKVLLLSVLYGLFILKESGKVCYDFVCDYDENSFDYFRGSNIYFVDCFDEVRDDGNIYVVDFRDEVDPNLVVNDSYRIRDLEMVRWVLNCLKLYNEMYPSIWDRSLSSMEYEWFVHNFSYDIGLFKDNCRNVDFNNYDEGKVVPGMGKYLIK